MFINMDYFGKKRHQKVLCVIFGWLDSKDKNLQKYSEFLEHNWGIQSIRYSMPFEITFGREKDQINWVKPILQKMLEYFNQGYHKILIYSFSNAGAYPVEQFCNLTQRIQKYVILQQSLIGIIFDSGPCHLDFQTARKAAHSEPSLTPQQKIFREQIVYNFFVQDKQKLNFWNVSMVQNMSKNVPCLYLYSLDDPLCDAEQLYQLIQFRQLKGADVYSKCWEISKHCAHFIEHKEEYVQHVDDFVKHIENLFQILITQSDSNL
eukprot:TRINITY_DN5085_c0_g4_i1.p1 TRINITY_DN5085_c0_g4~~TRINITY_DN5085_c0_g4_i1.p1  ORF type:complete len:263 (-),score=10.16 TRINITY_DN5085_c0_g4_i1:1524-2312(-)